MKKIIAVITLVMITFTSVHADHIRESKVNSLGIDKDTVWRFLDNGSDPAEGNSDRTVWSKPDFDDSGWQSAKAPFGSDKGEKYMTSWGYGGQTAETLLDLCDGENSTPTYYFRTKFNVSSMEDAVKIIGRVQYDSGLILYINGKRAAAFDDTAVTADGTALCRPRESNAEFGGSRYKKFTDLNFEIYDLSLIHEGENVIAAELVNGSADSPTVWFNMLSLGLSNEPKKQFKDIALSPGANETQLNFTWHSACADGNALIISKKDELVNGEFAENAKKYEARTEKSYDMNYTVCKTEVVGLEPGTAYTYELVNGEAANGKITFTTSAKGDFSFIYVADPQVGARFDNDGVYDKKSDNEKWQRTLNTLWNTADFEEASFIYSLGDQVNKAWNEEEYDMFLDHNIFKEIPIATTIGNHDTNSDAYQKHFNIANESEVYGRTAAGGDSYFIYNNVLFINLNNNNLNVSEHKAFIEDVLNETKDMEIIWKIVAFHRAVYTAGSHSTADYVVSPDGFRNGIVPILKDAGIDLVLQGHDHSYCRTYIMDGLDAVTQSEKYVYANGEDAPPTAAYDLDGTLYIMATSASGNKFYGLKGDGSPFAAVVNQIKKAGVSKISISDDSIKTVTYSLPDMTVTDSFTIYKHSKMKFSDITAKDAFYDDIDSLCRTGVIMGISEDRFAPYEPVTRAMAAAMLYRFVGTPNVNEEYLTGSWYADGANWAIEAGLSEAENGDFWQESITSKEFSGMLEHMGYNADKGSNRVLVRAEAAVMLNSANMKK